jgi:hypothetical protein
MDRVQGHYKTQIWKHHSTTELQAVTLHEDVLKANYSHHIENNTIGLQSFLLSLLATYLPTEAPLPVGEAGGVGNGGPAWLV